jgi:hypothetical protein
MENVAFRIYVRGTGRTAEVGEVEENKWQATGWIGNKKQELGCFKSFSKARDKAQKFAETVDAKTEKK